MQLRRIAFVSVLKLAEGLEGRVERTTGIEGHVDCVLLLSTRFPNMSIPSTGHFNLSIKQCYIDISGRCKGENGNADRSRWSAPRVQSLGRTEFVPRPTMPVPDRPLQFFNDPFDVGAEDIGDAVGSANDKARDRFPVP